MLSLGAKSSKHLYHMGTDAHNLINATFRQALHWQLAENEAIHNPAELAAWLGEYGPEDVRTKLEDESSRNGSLFKRDELLSWVRNWEEHDALPMRGECQHTVVFRRALRDIESAPLSKKMPRPRVPPQTSAKKSAASTGPARQDMLFLEVEEEAKIIGASIQTARGMLQGCVGDSLELALELIHNKNPRSEVKTEAEEQGDTAASFAGMPRIARVAVKDLRYTQESIKREFRDGRKFHQLVDDLLTGKVDPESHPNMQLEVVESNGRFFLMIIVG